MTRNRFVQPDTVRLTLSDNDWIEVKRALGYGEQQRLAGMILGKVGLKTVGAGDAEVGLEMERYSVERMASWILEWSFCDGQDKRVPVSRHAIAALDGETAAEIDAALGAHIEAMDAEKKVRTGESAVATTSA